MRNKADVNLIPGPLNMPCLLCVFSLFLKFIGAILYPSGLNFFPILKFRFFGLRKIFKLFLWWLPLLFSSVHELLLFGYQTSWVGPLIFVTFLLPVFCPFITMLSLLKNVLIFTFPNSFCCLFHPSQNFNFQQVIFDLFLCVCSFLFYPLFVSYCPVLISWVHFFYLFENIKMSMAFEGFFPPAWSVSSKFPFIHFFISVSISGLRRPQMFGDPC